MTQPGTQPSVIEPSTTPGRPVVFIHGLWLHATSWGPWVELFREAGYAPIAAGWPGTSDTVNETRGDPSRVAGKGIEDVVEHYAQIIRGLDAQPVVLGHSFGGLIVQRLLGQDLAAAGVAIDAPPIKGVIFVPPSAFRVRAEVGDQPVQHDAVAAARVRRRNRAEEHRHRVGQPHTGHRGRKDPHRPHRPAFRATAD